ncbi:uncharacterized protein [Fopius arisanus]|uniref:Syncc9605_0201 protein n=1 Tax=Fopius arisanus TaxID=64838 RepID=A0A0C9Q3W5_9HYME|nr:PREDICTED: uncharacterized protein LOC105266873 [Fopius arisanus]
MIGKLLVFGFMMLPVTLGDPTTCYANAETDKSIVKTKSLPCPKFCMKLEKILPDGTVVTARGCGNFQWEPHSSVFLDDLHLSSQQKDILLAQPPDTMHLCSGNYCNHGHSIKSTSSLLSFIIVIVAIVTTT